MQPATLNALECPGCRSPYRGVAHVRQGERILQGYLTCDCRAGVIPIVEGFAFFTEPLLHPGLADPASLAVFSDKWFGPAAAFEHLYEQKRSRSLFESYAAFQPFNESSRAIEPLMPRLRGGLREGDLVLDVWSRTGWSAEWLAGELPAQHVVALWEGNASVLGYRGYRHLLNIARRSPNLDVIFAHADRGLPFRNDAFGLLYAHDVLHRMSLHPGAAECLRVTRESGAMVFPHVHLSNNEPEPFFERGGAIRHGRDYRAWLDAVIQNSSRAALVCSEKTLFESDRSAEPVDEADTTHYNALITILPRTQTALDAPPQSDRDRFIVSPFFRIDLARSTASINEQSLGGGFADLMLRHPVYRLRLPMAPVSLAGSGLLALLLAASGLDRRSIVESLGAHGGTSAAVALRELAAGELLRPAPVSAGAHRLQRYHCNQLASLEDEVWPLWVRRLSGSEKPMLSLSDGTPVAPAEVLEFMLRVATWLEEQQISPREWICVGPGQHPLLWLTVIAAALSGVNVEISERSSSNEPEHQLWLDDEESLLARLTGGTNRSSIYSDRQGQISFLLDGHRVICRMEDFCRGCLTLQGQVTRQMWLLRRDDPVKNLASCALALASAGPLTIGEWSS